MEEPKPNTPQEIDFFDACKHGGIAPVQRLLAGGVSVNCRDAREEPWDTTGLMHAAEGGHSELVRLLLEAGAKVNLKDKSCPGEDGAFTALHYAALNGHSDVIVHLLKNGAKIDAVTKGAGGSPLKMAVSHKHIEAAAQLIKLGANPNLPDKVLGQTALQIAAQEGDEDIVRLLLRAGANVNSTDASGATPLMNAAWRRRSRVCRLLIKSGANLRATDLNLTTTLMWAVIGEDVAIVREMLEHHVAVNTRDDDGRTALDIAIRDKLREIERILRKAGGKTGAEFVPRSKPAQAKRS